MYGVQRRVECAEKHDRVEVSLSINDAAFDELEAIHQVELESFPDESAARVPLHIECMLVTSPGQLPKAEIRHGREQGGVISGNLGSTQWAHQVRIQHASVWMVESSELPRLGVLPGPGVVLKKLCWTETRH